MESPTDTVQSATERAALSQTSVHDGDGYGYGGDYVVTIGGRSIVLGPRDGKLAALLVDAVNAYPELTRAREREKELVDALDILAFHAAAMRKKLANANLPTGYADHEAIRDAERLVTARALAGGKP